MTLQLPTHINRPARPLLSRVAESAFWMSRYVERAEHVARVLTVNINSLLDVGDLDPQVEKQFWTGPLQIFLVDQQPEAQEILSSSRREDLASRIAQFLVFDPDNPNSIYSCITRARENARSMRESISAEMWENLNTLYWMIRGEDASGRFDESASDLLKQVTNGSLLFQGLSDQTLGHNQSWQFIQLGKSLERIDVTCRVIQHKFEVLHAVEESLENTERNMHLLSVVRSCCALESFRRTVGEIDADAIAAFLLLERAFPRSVCFCASHAHEAIRNIGQQVDAAAAAQASGAQSILGRLDADLQYSSPSEIEGQSLMPFLQKIQSATLEATIAVKKSYFLQ
jgi:uncharacterized alpha-E superfamily protein